MSNFNSVAVLQPTSRGTVAELKVTHADIIGTTLYISIVYKFN